MASSNQNKTLSIAQTIVGCWQTSYLAYSIHGTEKLHPPRSFSENLSIYSSGRFTQTAFGVDDKTFRQQATGAWSVALETATYAEIHFTGMKYFGAGTNVEESFTVYKPLDVLAAPVETRAEFTYPNDGYVTLYLVDNSTIGNTLLLGHPNAHRDALPIQFTRIDCVS